MNRETSVQAGGIFDRRPNVSLAADGVAQWSTAGDSSMPFTLLRLFVVGLIPFILVDASIYQLQMLVTGGRTPITAAVLKVCLFLALLAAAVLRARITNASIMKMGLVFLAYLVVDAMLFFFVKGLDFFDIIVSFNIYYLIFFIDILALCVPLRISDRLLTKVVVVCFLIAAPIGYAQYFTSLPLLPTVSSDNNFKVLVWDAAGGIRAFSLFIAPGFFGMFSSMVAALSIALCGRRRSLFYALPLLAMSIFACWISLTRSDLVGLVCAVISAAVFTFWKGRDRSKWLPLLYVPMGVLVGVYAYVQSMSGGSGTRTITDTRTFTERLYEWGYYLGTLRSADLPTILFGSGFIQSEKVNSNSSVVPIDNLYLAITLHTGVVGLLLMMALFWVLWEEVRKKAETRTSALYIAVAASLSTMWCVGLFSLSSAALGGMVLLCAVSKIDATSPA